MRARFLPLFGGGLLALFLLAVAGAAPSYASDEPLASGAARALRAKLEELGPQLIKNQFDRPLDLHSEALPNQLRGNIYAVIETPFDAVSRALKNPKNWCDVLILHLNTKHCKTSLGTGDKKLRVSMGKKTYEALDRITPLEFSFAASQTTPDFFELLLASKSGPMGTRDYRIQLEAVAIQGGRTFLHLNYAYTYNYLGLLAMKTYLATAGRGKVGFTPTPQSSAATPDYIGGMRGVVERNTMRYYLAIEAYLDALESPSSSQLDRRLRHWFSATERYRHQLHELDLEDYMAMKRQEYARMISLP